MSDDTPLSDRITRVLSSDSASTWSAFRELFLVSRLGIIMRGIPESASPRVYRVGAGDRVTTQVVSTPDGRRMIKACADPLVFARRYEPAINADMSGREILEMVLKVDDVAGVLVCSAASLHSLAIDRKDIPRLLGIEPKRAWWKLW